MYAVHQVAVAAACKLSEQMTSTHSWWQGNVEMRLRDYGSALESFRIAADLAPGISGTLPS